MKLPLTLTGTVIKGNHIGTGLDMPTANIIPDADVSEYLKGVYYSITRINGRNYKSISNLGCKPTVQDSKKINLETFIFDYEGELYGMPIEVDLLEFRRPERKFESLQELKETVHLDFDAGRKYEIH